MNKGKLKRCPSCGKFFSCQGDDDCWCESYKLHKKNMLVIMNEFKDCICPECLEKHAEK